MVTTLMSSISKGWYVMKRFFFVVVAAFALLIPNVASAQGARLIYRPELRAFVPAPQQATPAAQAPTLTPAETIARHEAMARGYRVNANGHSAATTAHCDRMIKQATEAARKTS